MLEDTLLQQDLGQVMRILHLFPSVRHLDTRVVAYKLRNAPRPLKRVRFLQQPHVSDLHEVISETCWIREISSSGLLSKLIRFRLNFQTITSFIHEKLERWI